MALEDKNKWDEKYKNTPQLLKKREASQKIKDFVDQVKGNKALDIACGNGRNSIFMASRGFLVDAIDISEVALDDLNKKAYENITTKQLDLDEFTPVPNSYDLIVQTNFLDRGLIPKLINALKKEGIIIIETYMKDDSNEKKTDNPNFLLEKEELKSIFSNGFKILDYDEFLNSNVELYQMRKQSIVAKKL